MYLPTPLYNSGNGCIIQFQFELLDVIQLRVIIYSSWIIPLVIKEWLFSSKNIFLLGLLWLLLIGPPGFLLAIIFLVYMFTPLYFNLGLSLSFSILSVIPGGSFPGSFSSPKVFHRLEFWNAAVSTWHTSKYPDGSKKSLREVRMLMKAS